jgi:hypothetical protein
MFIKLNKKIKNKQNLIKKSKKKKEKKEKELKERKGHTPVVFSFAIRVKLQVMRKKSCKCHTKLDFYHPRPPFYYFFKLFL